jgi:dihydrofolate reductase
VKTIYYTASSVDGFIADPANSLSWLLSRDFDQTGPMAFDTLITEMGAMAMGATTYEWIRDNHDREWSYGLPCWVFTHRDTEPFGGGDIRLVRDDVAAVHAEMVAAAAGKHVWLVGGGDLVGQFADLGLLDEVWVQYAPVTLGGGAPLLPRRIELRLEELARNSEFACARYAVVR